VNTELFDNEDTKWVEETPYDMRDEGMNDVLKAYTNNFAKDIGKPFKIKYIIMWFCYQNLKQVRCYGVNNKTACPMTT
jgi:hypothetical protein